MITKYLQIYGEVDTQWAGRVPEVVSVVYNTIKSRKFQYQSTYKYMERWILNGLEECLRWCQ